MAGKAGALAPERSRVAGQHAGQSGEWPPSEGPWPVAAHYSCFRLHLGYAPARTVTGPTAR